MLIEKILENILDETATGIFREIGNAAIRAGLPEAILDEAEKDKILKVLYGERLLEIHRSDWKFLARRIDLEAIGLDAKNGHLHIVPGSADRLGMLVELWDKATTLYEAVEGRGIELPSEESKEVPLADEIEGIMKEEFAI